MSDADDLLALVEKHYGGPEAEPEPEMLFAVPGGPQPADPSDRPDDEDEGEDPGDRAFMSAMLGFDITDLWR